MYNWRNLRIFVVGFQAITKMKKKSPVRLKDEEKTFLMTLNERHRRHFIACKAVGADSFAIVPLCKFLKVSTRTVCKGIRELRDGTSSYEGRIRKTRRWSEGQNSTTSRMEGMLHGDSIRAYGRRPDG